MQAVRAASTDTCCQSKIQSRLRNINSLILVFIFKKKDNPINLLITGTSSGIGHGLAQEYLEHGNHVWGISRRLANNLFDYKTYTHLQLDLTDYTQVQTQVPVFIGELSQLDMVILNAGILGDIGLISELNTDAMKQAMEINVWANKVLLDVLLASSVNVKQVIGMSSLLSVHASAGWGAYSVSKAALNMLISIYATEHPDTHFTSFGPGAIDSEIQESISRIQDTHKYPQIAQLQQMRLIGAMPDARQAAPRLINAIRKTLNYESGRFLDIRDLEQD